MAKFRIIILENLIKTLIFIKIVCYNENGEIMKKIVLFDNEYNVVKDEHDVFDLEEVSSLATDYFKPYDYIFGDYSYGKLRLKGFYNDNNKNSNKINKLSYLDSYIKNYCAYNCKYFLIEKLKKNE